MDVISQGRERKKLSSKLLHSWRPHSSACDRISADMLLWHPQMLPWLQSLPSPSSCYSLHLCWNVVIFSLFWSKFLPTFYVFWRKQLMIWIGPTLPLCTVVLTAKGLIAHWLFSCHCFLLSDGIWQHLSIQHTYTQDARITNDSNSEYTKKWYFWEAKSGEDQYRFCLAWNVDFSDYASMDKSFFINLNVIFACF